MTLPLEGIKVLELAQTLAGPFVGQLLGDLGADVIKVEKLTGDETRAFRPPEWNDESMFYLANNRNKRSITVNLKDPDGVQIIRDLAKECDIVIENFRTGTADKLGFGYQTLKEINPKIIYLSISGFGRTGPEKDRAGYDLIVQAFSGTMSITGEPGRPPAKTGVSVVDLTAGLVGSISILAALRVRETTGQGQYLDCSLLDSQLLMLNYLILNYLGTGKSPGPMGSGHPSLVPYQGLKAKDQYVIVAAANDNLWKKLCIALDWQDLLEIDKYKTNKSRVLHKEELITIISQRVSELTAEEICSRLDAAGVPCSPVNTIGQMMSSPQVQFRNTIVDIPHPNIDGLKAPIFPVKFATGGPEVRRHPPSLGENSEEILREIEYDHARIQGLKERGVIS